MTSRSVHRVFAGSTCAITLLLSTASALAVAPSDDGANSSRPGRPPTDTRPMRSADLPRRDFTPTDAQRAAEVMRQHNVSLTKAIDTAEDHCKGQAVDARCRAMSGPNALLFDVTCLDKAGQVMVVSVDGTTGKVASMSSTAGAVPGDAAHTAILKASDFPGRNVVDAANEKIADVQELAIDTSRGRVAYAVLDVTSGPNRPIAVPWSALSHQEKTCMIDGSGKERLANAPSFESGTWPNMTTDEFSRRVADYYGQPVYGDNVAVPSGSTPVIMKASDIIGGDVRSAADENLGDIKDLAIEPRSGRIAYAVLSFGGFLGIKDKLFAVPLEALSRRTDGKWVLAVEKERLKDAPGFDKKNWPIKADPTLDAQVREFYGKRAAVTKP